ncbi:hypothetical protein A2U01_0117532, partial [Trifolium medium]|nr:hypothetical protein [Trifolium medium]
NRVNPEEHVGRGSEAVHPSRIIC